MSKKVLTTVSLYAEDRDRILKGRKYPKEPIHDVISRMLDIVEARSVPPSTQHREEDKPIKWKLR